MSHIVGVIKLLNGAAGYLSTFLSPVLASNEELPAGNIIAFDFKLIIDIAIILLNVLVLFAVLALVLYKPVKRFLQKRADGIQSELDEAANTLKEAQTLKEEYEVKLAEIDEERRKELDLAHKHAMERSDQILKEANEEAENIKEHALLEMEEERKNMQDEINKQLVELSVLISSRFLEDAIDPATHEKYIDQALFDWEEGL